MNAVYQKGAGAGKIRADQPGEIPLPTAVGRGISQTDGQARPGWQLLLAKRGEVPLREQIRVQIMLAILSGDLQPGQKLPSRGMLARRYLIHPNTVSAAYHELSRQGWIIFREGCGFYVRPPAERLTQDAARALDQSINAFLRQASELGFSVDEIRARFAQLCAQQQPGRILVIEPNPELRTILMAEVAQATGCLVSGADFKECADPARLSEAIPVTLYVHAAWVRAKLPAGVQCLFLRSHSVSALMRTEPLPARDAVVTVVSRWDNFLQWAQTILAAIGIDPDALNLRDARVSGWLDGLRASDFVLTDSFIARLLPADCPAHVFRIIADASLNELRRLFPQTSQI